MKNIGIVVIAVIASWLMSGPANANLGPVIQKIGTWEIHRSQDNMTDKVQCIATMENDTVQLDLGSLFIRIRGGPKGYEFRVDTDQPSKMIVVGDTERQVSAIDLSKYLSRISAGERLRVSVITYAAGILEMDLGISGIAQAQNFIRTSPACR